MVFSVMGYEEAYDYDITLISRYIRNQERTSDDRDLYFDACEYVAMNTLRDMLIEESQKLPYAEDGDIPIDTPLEIAQAYIDELSEYADCESASLRRMFNTMIFSIERRLRHFL
jgi:hypothetical protein